MICQLFDQDPGNYKPTCHRIGGPTKPDLNQCPDSADSCSVSQKLFRTMKFHIWLVSAIHSGILSL